MHHLLHPPYATDDLNDPALREITRAMRHYVLAGEKGADEATLAGWERRMDALVTAYRTDRGALAEERLCELMVRERERVLYAIALGEIVAPLVADHIRPLAGPATAPPRAGDPRVRRPSGPTGAEGTPPISDLIDDMLAQDAMPSGAARRQAS